jgi:hypothetical protein
MREKYGSLAIFVLVIALTLGGLVSYAHYRSAHGWDDAARSLAWSVGVDRNVPEQNEGSLLGFRYTAADIVFLRSVEPPSGFVRNEATDGLSHRVWDGRWKGYDCNLSVTVDPPAYWVVVSC